MKKILLISLGSIGKRHLRNTRDLLPDATIGVFRQHTKTGHDVPEGANLNLTSLDDAIAFKPDAVIVASPASEHIKNSVPFLNTGIPLFLEKPLADSTSELALILDAAEGSPGFQMLGYILRFLPALHEIKALLQSDKIGNVRTARVQVGQYLPDWRPESDYRLGVSAQKKLGGGALLELSHEIDYSLWLFGQPDSVVCSAATVSDLEIDVEDSAYLILEYDGAAKKRVCLQLDFLQRVPKMTIEIVGSKATLEADLIAEKIKIISPDHPKGLFIDSPRYSSGNEIYLRQFDFFFKKSFADYKPRFMETVYFNQWADIASGANVLHLVEMAKRSQFEGRRVSTRAD